MTPITKFQRQQIREALQRPGTVFRSESTRTTKERGCSLAEARYEREQLAEAYAAARRSRESGKG